MISPLKRSLQSGRRHTALDGVGWHWTTLDSIDGVGWHWTAFASALDGIGRRWEGVEQHWRALDGVCNGI